MMSRFQPPPFDYIPPNEESVRHLEVISAKVRELYDTLLAEAPESAELTLAVRKLQECRMWANASVVFGQERA